MFNTLGWKPLTVYKRLKYDYYTISVLIESKILTISDPPNSVDGR